MSVLAKLIDRRLARLADTFGLSVAEYRVLAHVAMQPRSTVRTIADQTFVDKAQVSRAAATLEEKGFVSRAIHDHDRRSPVFTATRIGKTLMRRIDQAHHTQEQSLVGRLAEADLVALSATLSVLIATLAEPGPLVGPIGNRQRQIRRPPQPRSQ